MAVTSYPLLVWVKLAVGKTLGIVVTNFELNPFAPRSSVIYKVALKVPIDPYVWDTLDPIAVFPSPKVHE